MRPATWTSEQPSNPARLTPSTTNEYINKTIRTDDMGTPPVHAYLASGGGGASSTVSKGRTRAAPSPYSRARIREKEATTTT